MRSRTPVISRWRWVGTPVAAEIWDFRASVERIGEGNFRVRVLPSRSFTKRLWTVLVSSMMGVEFEGGIDRRWKW